LIVLYDISKREREREREREIISHNIVIAAYYL